MRSLAPSIVVGCLASCWAVGLTPGALPPPKPPAMPAPASAADNDAAKHAKRTLCLKQAKAKKLVDPQRTAYVKECMGSA